MFDLSQIRVLHLEITSHCNAACPMCARFKGDELSPDVTLNDLSVSDIAAKLSEEFVRGLDKMFMCGNHGDPAAGKHTIEAYEWFRKVNPSITLGMNTNGGIKTRDWWTRLGKILNRERDYVIFSIDGLEDTNHIYRRNVSWAKLMENAQSFIAAGGQAHWEMLVFEHNEFQVDAARDLASRLGFKFFRSKVSRRFPNFNIPYIKPPSSYTADFHQTAIDVDCMALKEKSIYMDCTGRLIPCCWLGNGVMRRGETYDLNTFVPTKDNPTCLTTCGKTNKNNFEKQWI